MTPSRELRDPLTELHNSQLQLTGARSKVAITVRRLEVQHRARYRAPLRSRLPLSVALGSNAFIALEEIAFDSVAPLAQPALIAVHAQEFSNNSELLRAGSVYFARVAAEYPCLSAAICLA